MADAESTVGGLVFHGRVPPAVEVNYMVGGGQVQTHPARFQGKDHEGNVFFAAEALHELETFFYRRLPVEYQPLPLENPFQAGGQGLSHFPELGEDQRPLPLFRDCLADFLQPFKLAAVLGGKIPLAQELVGVIAHLLGLHQAGQNQAPALHARRCLQLLGQLLYQFIVEDHLFFAKAGIGFEFHFVRQVGNDGLVGLEAAEYEGAHRSAQGGVALALAQPVRRFFKFLGGPQEAAVEKVKEGPQVPQTVFDGGAGEGDSGFPFQPLHRLGLLGGGVFYGLGFV